MSRRPALAVDACRQKGGPRACQLVWRRPARKLRGTPRGGGREEARGGFYLRWNESGTKVIHVRFHDPWAERCWSDGSGYVNEVWAERC